mmetsp:Transcript_29105/g.84592  ORF Transcript_29105/g.84592 Transcript_29105/m.84592 type:complete len:291 (-) Transcript_29105:432-1304(-)
MASIRASASSALFSESSVDATSASAACAKSSSRSRPPRRRTRIEKSNRATPIGMDGRFFVGVFLPALLLSTVDCDEEEGRRPYRLERRLFAEMVERAVSCVIPERTLASSPSRDVNESFKSRALLCSSGESSSTGSSSIPPPNTTVMAAKHMRTRRRRSSVALFCWSLDRSFPSTDDRGVATTLVSIDRSRLAQSDRFLHRAYFCRYSSAVSSNDDERFGGAGLDLDLGLGLVLVLRLDLDLPSGVDVGDASTSSLNWTLRPDEWLDDWFDACRFSNEDDEGCGLSDEKV